MLLPLRHNTVVSVARLAVLALVSGTAMQYLLRLLEERRLALHVKASEGNLRVGRVIYVVLLWTHVEEHSVRLLVREASRAARVIAGQLGVQELQMPSIYTSAFLWMGRAVFELWIVEAPAAIAKDLVLIPSLKGGILWLLRLVVA